MSFSHGAAPKLTVVPQRDLVALLTPRELEVLGLMAAGLDNAGICAQLWIGGKTVEHHIQQIFLKLELPVDSGRHRRVSAVLAYLRSPLARAELSLQPSLPAANQDRMQGHPPSGRAPK